MPDHINIANPERGEREWEHRRQVELLRTEITVLSSERDHYRTQLEALHTRIGRGDECWLDIDGEKVIVRAAPPSPADPTRETAHDPL